MALSSQIRMAENVVTSVLFDTLTADVKGQIDVLDTRIGLFDTPGDDGSGQLSASSTERRKADARPAAERPE